MITNIIIFIVGYVLGAGSLFLGFFIADLIWRTEQERLNTMSDAGCEHHVDVEDMIE